MQEEVWRKMVESNKTDPNRKTDRDKTNEVYGGVALGVAGFVLVVVGASALPNLKIISMSSSAADLAILFGLAVLVAGCGLFGYGWAEEKWPDQSLTTAGKWSVVLTFAATVVVAVIAVWADSAKDVLWTVVAVGAFGGLVHEIAQSKGTAFLPWPLSGSNSTGGSDNKSGEGYLGGLAGIVLGGAAGLIALSTASSTTLLSTQLIATAFAAGVALKGISDSVSSSTANSAQTKTTQTTQTTQTQTNTKPPG